jgi:transcription antitermination factor NusG
MTKPGKQEEVATRLKNASFSVFNPKLNQYSKKRSTYITQPLFPLYLFVKLDIEKDFKTITYTRGTLRILGIGRTPHPINENIILEIMNRCKEGDVIDAKHNLEDDIKQGDAVQITNGPLEGIEAVVSGIYNDKQRVEILFELMKVSVDKNSLKKL